MKLFNAEITSKSILVIGDVMLDVYYTGEVERISPEAPVPVFKKKREKSVLGGAANVASNLAVNDQHVYIMSVIGKDSAGAELKKMLEENLINTEFLSELPGRCTTVKTRFLANNNQQVMRLDEEVTEALETIVYEANLEKLKDNIDKFDVVLISDYLKGFLSWDFTRQVIRCCNENGKKVVIDVKDNKISKYESATLLKPNLKELKGLTGLPVNTKEEIIFASEELRKKAKSEYVLTTCGAKGMVLIGDGDPFMLDSFGKEVFDVTGAGDTTVAYLVMALASGIDLKTSVKISNYAASVQVGKVGTSAVTMSEVAKAIGTEIDVFNNKLVDICDCDKIRNEFSGKKIVFTNGCFDILHVGHVRYLREASALGDVLVVGLNSDNSVRRLKGSGRPVNSEIDRAEMLCSYDFIDKVVIFDEDTPLELINKIQPDVLVKGGDYKDAYVVGTKEVEARGGKLVLLPFVDGKSTTNIIKKVQP